MWVFLGRPGEAHQGSGTLSAAIPRLPSIREKQKQTVAKWESSSSPNTDPTTWGHDAPRLNLQRINVDANVNAQFT